MVAMQDLHVNIDKQSRNFSQVSSKITYISSFGTHFHANEQDKRNKKLVFLT